MVGHCADSGEKWRERAHDRYEAADDDRESTVFFVEAVGSLEVLGLQKSAEPAVLRTVEYLGPDIAADAVVDRVAEYGREEQGQSQKMHVDAAGGEGGVGVQLRPLPNGEHVHSPFSELNCGTQTRSARPDDENRCRELLLRMLHGGTPRCPPPAWPRSRRCWRPASPAPAARAACGTGWRC